MVKAALHPSLPDPAAAHRNRSATVERVVQPEHTIQVVDPKLPASFFHAHDDRADGARNRGRRKACVAAGSDFRLGTRIEVDHLKAVGNWRDREGSRAAR